MRGGYSGLNPVYAATPVYHDVVKYDSANRTLDYEYDAGAGTGTAAIQKINFGNIVLDGSSGAGVITATGLKLNGIGDVKTAIEGKADQAAVTDNKNNIQTLETKTKNISYNATTGTTVEGVVLKDKGISVAGGKFTVKADGQTVFTGDPNDKGKTTIKNGETVVEGANGKVTINNGGIEIAQKAQDTGENYSIKLDSGYVKASGYVQAPKFYIDNNNVFAKEADGTSRLTVSDVDEIGAVTKFVRIGGGTISASGDVNVAGNLWVGKTSIFNDGINTDKIDEKTTGAGVTVEGVKFKAGAVSGISDINDGIIKFSKNGTKDIVQINSDLMFNDDAGRQAATLTLEGVKTLNGLSNGSSKIEADDGSVVGGVKFDNKNITDVDSVMVNKDANNQVQINSEGIVVGLHSTVIGSDGVYAGGHTATTAKAVLGADGSIKGAGDGAGKYKFTVDSSNGTVTINDGGNVATISGGGISIADASGSDYLTMGKGTVLASASVISPKFFVDPNNAFEKNSLKVGDGTKGVTIADGEITTTGDATVGGNLSVAGTSTFTGGINTDTIDEATADKGVTVDGVLLKDKGIDAADGKFTVDDKGNIVSKGSVTANQAGFNNLAVTNGLTVGNATGDFVNMLDGNVTATGKMKSKTLSAGTNGDEFTVDENGNVVAKGTVSAADGKFTVGADGAVKAANGKFAVDKDGNTTVGGKLDVTGDTTLGGNLGVTGNATVGGTLDVTGNATVGGTLGVTGDISTDGSVTAKGGLSAADGKFTIDGATGNAAIDGTLKSKGDFSVGDADQFTVDAATGNVVSKGKITSDRAKIGAVEIANDGTITGVKAITTDTLTVNNGFITNGNIESKGLKVNGNAEITGTLDVNGAVKGASFNGAAITATTFNGATIDATHFNNVTLSGGNVEANSIKGTTITGTTVTDGAGANMNAGTVKGTTITDGSGFTATGGNVSAKDVTATGTVKGTTVTDGVAKMSGGKVTAQNGVEVDANNYLNSSGLKTSNIDASKATIGKIKIEGSKITSTEADETVGIAGITVNNAGALNNVTSIDGVAVSGSAASGLTVGAGATAVTIGGNSLALSSTNFNVDDDGDVKGKSFTAGTSHLKDGELKLNDKNIWNTTEGIRAEKATIGANTLNGTGFSTTGTLDVAGKATFGSNAANSTTIEQGAVSVNQNGKTTTIKGGEIETDKLTVNDIVLKNSMKDGTGNTINIKGSDGSMSIASGAFAVDKDGQLTNKISGTAGGYSYETKLETSKSGIKANYTNAINGNQNIIDMGANGISIGVAGTTPSVGAGFKAELDAATMGYGTANSIVINKETIKSALGTGVTRVMTNNTTEQSIVDKVGTAKRRLKADEIVDEVAGMTVKTNSDGTLFTNGTTNTLINGSAITSTNGSATGVLDGSNLTLTNGANSTVMTAGGATFNGAAGEKGGTQTIINGGTITTDTLNVERINLGEDILDSNGTPHGSNLSMDKQGNFSAAGGNFKVTGGSGADKGAMTNKVGNTTLTTDTTGASMNYAGTANSNISVADGKAEMAVGTNAAVTATDGKVEIKGGTQNVTTTGAGTVFENSAHNTPFVTGGAANTVINGNEITTGKLTTDQLVITGSGAAGGAGSIAFGGDGSITSNIKDAATGKEATFKTNADGTFTEAKDGANVTTNTVNAQGNTNKVTDGTNTSTATQTATSIGGVVTNGTVTMKQELTADGLKLEQTGYDEVNIAKGDVTVKNNRNTANPNQEVHLSDLGSLNNLDSELTARDEYKDNKTAVGAINAEAGIRREEVARLDNRIDDVNNRVDKVGAMAAAIASLKSIGYDPQAPSEFSIGLGQYKGETGVAMGFFHYPNKNFMINVSLSTAGGETMGGIGATWRFGHKSPQKLLDEQREAQARKELAAAEKYQAAAKLAKEAQERAEYAAKLARQAQVSADNAKAAADATQAKHFQ